ncbi:MAG: acyltransferase [Thermodesulfovibrionales bacterium]|nr:acyltransferase [Thermodesulfovibrionales bacterium]
MPLLSQNTKIRIQKYSGLPKSLFLNFKYFGLKNELKLPILLTNKVVLRNCKGTVKINAPLRRGMIIIGFTAMPLSTNKEYSLWNVEGEVIFNGTATLGAGTKINVGMKGELIIGDKFEITANSSISCHNSIKIGTGCLLSWDILLMDTDGHPVYNKDGHLLNPNGEIVIDDDVWVGYRCLILKNAHVAHGSIIASGSVLNKRIETPNSLIAGVPAVLKKEKR